jgi:AcrR family transcriptional regulator
MSLLAEQKQQRRDRILQAARRLVAERGFHGLTMRDLAARSRVSVPTLYNLFGSKRAILLADAERTVQLLTGALDPQGHDFFDKVLAIYRAGASVITSMPDYYRQLLYVLATSGEAHETRHGVESRFIDMMTAILREGQQAKLLATWIDADALSREMWSRYVMALGRWALGELDADKFLDASVFGMCMTLLGVARGSAAKRIETRARQTQAATVPSTPPTSAAERDREASP